ncbi:MAG: aminoacetone oxidase family FAD-binding enzyme [Candidatus Borkfalkiaceae bacterium]|nr:aminoacetone oxidase family FAD-binding enzyme [Christensenellaceae bacterium]
MKVYKVAVVGGGASGLVAGIFAGKEFGSDVVILEKTDRVGKKLLSTGNGRGNVTNEILSAKNYHSYSGCASDFVLPAISRFDNNQTTSFLREIGVVCSAEDGKVYPMSKQASSVLDMMRAKIASLGTEVLTGFEVIDIERGKPFKISSSGSVIYAENVIFACGGKCAKQFGTDGSAFGLLKKLGHKITPLFPSLVQLKTDGSLIKGLKGIKQYGEVKIITDGKAVGSAKGDVLFTDYGISGNAVFFVSSYCAGKNNASVSIDFLPEISFADLKELLSEKAKNAPYLSAEDLLNGVINKQIGKNILKSLGIDLNKKCPLSRINDVSGLIKSFKLKVEGTLGFDYAQVTRGGVCLSEVESSSLSSKLCKGLYIVGEALDIDGDCGGYNLQWAFSSAYAACEDIIRRAAL